MQTVHVCRIGDDDPRNSPSSLQRFAGEDLRLAEQRRAQHALNQAAWAAQHAEHAAAEAAAAAESRTAAQLVGIVSRSIMVVQHDMGLVRRHGSCTLSRRSREQLASRQNCYHML